MLRILFFTLLSFGVSAQSLQLAWFNQMDNMHVADAKLDPSGNVILAGTFSGTVDFDFGPNKDEHTANGLYDAFVAKYDAYGNFKWVATVGNQNPEEVSAIDIDPNGNIYATGEFTGTQDFDPGPGTYGLTVYGYVDVFVWVLKPDGTILRAHAIGGRSYESPLSISVQKDGYVALGGFFWGNPDMDHDPNVVKQVFSQGLTDAFVLKMAPNGGVQWVRSYGTPGHERIHNVYIDDQQRVHLTGYAGPNTDFDPHPIGVRQAPANGGGFLLKLKSNGDIDELKSLPVVPSRMIANTSGYYMSGNFSGTKDFDLDSSQTANQQAVGNQTPLYAWHIDTNFQFEYVKTWPRANLFDHSLNFAGGAHGGIVIAGNFNDTIDLDPSAFSDIRWTEGMNDMFAVHLDSNGAYTFGNVWGSGLHDLAAYALMNNDGELYFGGTFQAQMDFDPAPSIYDYGNPLGEEAFMLKLTYCQEVVGHDTVEACNEYTWMNQHTYNDSHTGDRYIIQSPQGCDSIVYLHLTINFLPTGLNQQDSLFTAHAPQALYQWFNCDSNQIIPGEINRNFVADTFGTYAVIVSNSNCLDTSDCFTWSPSSNVSLPEQESLQVELYPNPSDGQVKLQMDDRIEEFELKVFDLSGQLHYQKSGLNQGIEQLDLPPQKGLYIIRLSSQDEVWNFKVQKI